MRAGTDDEGVGVELQHHGGGAAFQHGAQGEAGDIEEATVQAGTGTASADPGESRAPSGESLLDGGLAGVVDDQQEFQVRTQPVLHAVERVVEPGQRGPRSHVEEDGDWVRRLHGAIMADTARHEDVADVNNG